MLKGFTPKSMYFLWRNSLKCHGEHLAPIKHIKFPLLSVKQEVKRRIIFFESLKSFLLFVVAMNDIVHDADTLHGLYLLLTASGNIF